MCVCVFVFLCIYVCVCGERIKVFQVIVHVFLGIYAFSDMLVILL